MKTVVFFIPKDRRKATLRQVQEFGLIERIRHFRAFLDAIQAVAVDAEIPVIQKSSRGYNMLKIRHENIPHAVAVLRFAGFELIADESELKGKK